ncbi:hypothetical protein BGZ73_007819 [Actinomortierella ambigua]|nr:hypothetical protein BGZ73_007819 [Actinomortierella ambigua]
MSAIQLVAGTLFVAFVVASLLNYFGNRRQHAWYVSLVAFVSWFFPFSIVGLVPLDLSSTLYRSCNHEDACKEPFTYVSQEFLVAAWRTMYWSSFVLTWVLIPILQAYTQSGQFTVMKRLRNAVRDNLIYQMIIGVVALLGLLYVIYSIGTKDLRAYLMALSNSWGLILVVVFMGYGMVEVPRRLWHKGDNERELRRISFKASAVKDTKQDTEEEVMRVAKMQPSDPLKPLVDKMVHNFPEARSIQFESSRTSSPLPGSARDRSTPSNNGRLFGSSQTPATARTVGRKSSVESMVPAVLTENYLANLNARIKKALRMRDRWTAIWHDLLQEGFLAQDIQENADNPERKFRSTLRPLNNKPTDFWLKVEWHWYLRIRPVCFRVASVFCALVSIVIVWSEVTFKKGDPPLSIIGLLIQLAKKEMSYGAIEAVSFFTMLYMCACAYSSLLKMRLLNIYVLVPNHHTDEPTLLFMGSYLCRLTFPLVYNFLTIGKEDSTEFAEYMGRMNMVPLLGKFNDYMPYAILVPTLITLFNVFAKMFAICSISDTFFEDDDSDEGGIGGDIEEGRQVLQDARREQERILFPSRAGFHRDFSSRRVAALDSYNNNKKAGRGRPISGAGNDFASRNSLGEGSSASAWREARALQGARHHTLQEPYHDDSTDDDEGTYGRRHSEGYGRLDTFDPFRGMSSGAGSFGGRSSGFDSPSFGRSRSPLPPPLPQPSGPDEFRRDDDDDSQPGAIKSLWQKLTGKKKPAIVLDGNSRQPGMSGYESDSRSSLESVERGITGTGRGGQGGDSARRGVGAETGTGAEAPRAGNNPTGPALMFTSIQRTNDDRESLLGYSGSNTNTGRIASGARSPTRPQSFKPSANRPQSGYLQTSSGGEGALGRPGATRNPRLSEDNRRGGASPLINFFSEDDDGL